MDENGHNLYKEKIRQLVEGRLVIIITTTVIIIILIMIMIMIVILIKFVNATLNRS